MALIKIEKQMFNTNYIQKVDPNATINGQLGVSIALWGTKGTFDYTCEFAGVAYDILEQANALQPAPQPTGPAPSVVALVTVNGVVTSIQTIVSQDGVKYCFIVLDSQTINVEDIEWVDFTANFDGITGVELRVAIDPVGQTRQFTGEAARTAWDVLSPLATNEDFMIQIA